MPVILTLYGAYVQNFTHNGSKRVETLTENNSEEVFVGKAQVKDHNEKIQ